MMESREFQKSALYALWGITGRESEYPPCDVKTPLNISYDYDLLTRMKLSARPDLVLRCDSFMSNRKNKQLAWLFLHLFSDCFVKCVRRNPGPEHQRGWRRRERWPGHHSNSLHTAGTGDNFHPGQDRCCCKHCAPHQIHTGKVESVPSNN